jgi:enolase
MFAGNRIKNICARQVFTRQEYSGLGHPAIETTIITEDGSSGTAIATGGFSVGEHEIHYLYDKGELWKGRGVQKAVENVN